MDTRYLYRVLRPDEVPQVGIVARDPASMKSLNDYLTYNDNKGSRYISTCMTLTAAQAFASDTFYKPVRIIKINVQSLERCDTDTVREIINLTLQNMPTLFARYCVTKYQEVLIVGRIPPQCIENVSLFAPTNNIGTQFLYSVLRPEEYVDDIYPKNPESTRSVDDHVSNGSENSSKYISTSKTLKGAQKFAWNTIVEPVRIAVIDVDTLLSCDSLAEIIDLTNPLVMNRNIREENKVARQRVEKTKEVLIVGNIPAKCIVNVYLFLKDDLKISLKNMFPPTNNIGTQLLYRVLRPDEYEDLQDDIYPKNPESTICVEDHVRYGSKINYQSKYISTSKTLIGAQKFALKTTVAPVRIAVIDVDTLLSCYSLAEIIDLTNPLVMNLYIREENTVARQWVEKTQEVLIVGNIPAKCIVNVYSFSKIDLENALCNE